MKLVYERVSGSLPIGVTIDKSGELKGFLDFENIGVNPEWTTPAGLIKEVDEEETITLPALQALPREGRVIESYGIVERSTEKYCLLPWGLVLDSQTGIISGTLIEHGGDLLEKTWYDGEEPQWVTSGGNLVTLDELQKNVSVQLTATSPVDNQLYYSLFHGYLPSGLTLDSLTGTIAGDLAPLQTTDNVDINLLFNKPRWVSLSGSLGVFHEADEVRVSVEAVSQNGPSQVFYSIHKGTLPSGLTLNSLTGEITGTCLELREKNVPVFEFGNAPVISNSVIVNKQEIQVGDGGLVLTANRGDIVNIKFSAIPHSPRQIESFSISNDNSDNLPLGLTLNPLNGEISGIISTFAKSGEYNVELVVLDTKYVFSKKKYKIIVE